MSQRQKQQRESAVRVISDNRHVRHHYTIEETQVAGLVLEGWEVKSLRAGQANIREAYVRFKSEQAYLVAAHFAPCRQTCTHQCVTATRERKLLLSKTSIIRLSHQSQDRGYTLAVLNLHWKGPWAKCTIALVKGKKAFDKRREQAQKAWQREKGRLFRDATKRENAG